MADLSKQEIKEVFIQALEPFAKSVQIDFQKVNGRLDTMDGRLDSVDGRLDSMDGRLTNLEQDVRWMKENFSELFTKLDKFISLYEKQEQELLALGAQLRRLEERVAKLETKQ